MSLLVDSVGEVLWVGESACESVPPTLRGPARELTEAVVKLNDRLLLRLNTQTILGRTTAAATPVYSENI